jgi:hypothetical protein
VARKWRALGSWTCWRSAAAEEIVPSIVLDAIPTHSGIEGTLAARNLKRAVQCAAPVVESLAPRNCVRLHRRPILQGLARPGAPA